MVVTQISKVRNDPLGQWSPYGTPIQVGAPGEWRPQQTAQILMDQTISHRTAPSRPGSAPTPAHRAAPRYREIPSRISSHLQLPPRSRDPLEGRAVRRAVQWEARAKELERRLAEVSVRVPTLVSAVRSREETIKSLSAELETLRHALAVAQSRIWQPGHEPREPPAREVPLRVHGHQAVDI
jgi:uncharacterized coiled-coil protein SlyX